MRLILAVALLAASGSARAEDKEAARKAYSEGARYYNLNQYAEALEAFKRAYWNYEEPSFLYNIAQCHRALKHKAEAIEFYRSYLRNAPHAPNRAEVERIISELEAAEQKDKAVADAPPEGPLAAPAASASPPASTAPAPAAVTPAPAATTPAPAAAIATTGPPAAAERPLWKRGWFWGVIGGAAVVVAGVAVGVAIGTSTTRDPAPSLGRSTVN